MTIHVGFICDAYTLQIGDRLLTTASVAGKSRVEWDPFANKSIFLQALNGRVAIGYAGLAFIAGMPTDEWLVTVITGQYPSDFGEISGGGRPTRFGPRLNLTLGQTCHLIMSAIERDLPRERFRDEGLEVMICGWTWPKDIGKTNSRPSTFAQMIAHRGKPNSLCHVESAARRRYRPESPNWELISIGAGDRQLLRTITSRVSERGRTTADDVELIIRDCIREFASRPERGVGENLVSIYLPISLPEHPRVRYLRSVETDRDIFTPSVIMTGGLIMYPQVLNSVGFGVSYGGTEDDPAMIQFDTLPPLPNFSGIHRASSALRRRQ